jgi:hypothetical protein
MPPFAAAGQPPRQRADPADRSLRLRLSAPANDRGSSSKGRDAGVPSAESGGRP